MPDWWRPPLELRERGGRCRLWPGGWAHGHGETLQQAGDELRERVLGLSPAERYPDITRPG